MSYVLWLVRNIIEDVVLVTISYRLGVLGFLNTGDGVVRGNMGLKDQVLALKWIKENISAFQGNPDAVTLIGESAGGVSVHNHILSPKSNDFSRAIIQSGSALSSWALYRNVKEQSIRFAKKFNCPVDNSKAMVSCLKQLDARTLVGGHEDMRDFFRPRIAFFGPSIEAIHDDDAFIVEEPIEILKKGTFSKVPVMTGCTSDEGLLVTGFMAANQTKFNEANDDWSTWAPRILQYEKELTEVTSKLRKFYFGDETTPINDTKFLKNFTDMIGDRIFNFGIAQNVLIQSKFVPMYLYYLDYKAQHTLSMVFTSTQGKFHNVVNLMLYRLNSLFHRHVLGQELPHLGTSHGDDVRLLFSGKWIESLLYSKEMDYEMSKDIVKLFSEFAKAEKILKFRNVVWPPVTKDSIKYLKISNEPEVIDDPFSIRRKFWESLNIPNY